MANAPLPPFLLLEDALDLVDFYEATGRTVPRDRWADECVAHRERAEQRAAIQRMLYS